jgi:hypothetical protein
VRECRPAGAAEHAGVHAAALQGACMRALRWPARSLACSGGLLLGVLDLTWLLALGPRAQAESESADPLDGSKYLCHVSEEYASGLAASLGLRLTDYVKYA